MELDKIQLKRIERAEHISKDGEIAIIKELGEIDERIDVVETKIETTSSELTSKVEQAISIAQETQKMPGEAGHTPVKGVDYEDGKDYILKEDDLDIIASIASQMIDVPIVEKVIEKIIVEKPLITEVTNNIENKDTGELIINKINLDETSLIKREKIDGNLIDRKTFDEDIATLQNRTQLLIQIATQRSNSSGGISGTGVANRLAYWNGASSLTSSANLTFNGTTLTTSEIVSPTFRNAASTFLWNDAAGLLSLGGPTLVGLLRLNNTLSNFSDIYTSDDDGGLHFLNGLNEFYFDNGRVEANRFVASASGSASTFAGTLGIKTITPRGVFDVDNSVTNTIANVTTTDNAIYPTYGGSGYATANGYTWTYNVRAYKTVDETRVYSAAPLVYTFVDNGSASALDFTFSWTAVAGAEGYRIIVVNDTPFGATGNYYTDIPAPSTSAIYYLDDSGGFESNSGTYYTGGNTVTPTSVITGPDFYINSTTGNFYKQGSLMGIFTDNGVTLTPVKNRTITVDNDDNTISSLKIKRTETASSAASSISVTDLTGIEQLGMSSWGGGGGLYGYGALVMSNSRSGFTRFGEISPRDYGSNGDRVGSIVFDNYTGNIYECNIDFYTSNGSNTYILGLHNDKTGRIGINMTAPTARLHITAGTTAASTAPIKLNSGPLNTTAEAGAIEFLTDKLYSTITTGAARKELTLNDVALTSGRVPVVTTNGRLTDDADFSFATDTLTATKIIAPTSIQVGGGAVITRLDFGTYTPTLFNTTNVAASTARLCTYMRVGNTVTVSGQFDIDPTAPASATLMGVSLPVASNFSTAYQLGGTAYATAIASMGAGIEADATNDRASVKFVSSDINNQTMTFTYSYQII